MTKPTIYMIAGPNGAGKTTTALKLLPKFLAMHEFVNSDEIARGLNPLEPKGQSVAAGRLLIQRIDDLIAGKKSFAFEATGASIGFTDKLKAARNSGYKLGLLYLWLPSADFAKKRVRWRVAHGGHDVPESDIERRFTRSLKNLIRLYLPLADEAAIYDSSKAGTNVSELIAEKKGARLDILQPRIWESIEKIAGKDEDA